MTLREKRKIVLAFKAGTSMQLLAAEFRPSGTPWIGQNITLIEKLLREYLNGKFKLEAKKK